MGPTEPLSWLAPRISRDRARELLVRGRFGRTRRLKDRHLGRLELVVLPCLVLTSIVRADGHSETVRCLVDRGVARAVWLTDELAQMIDQVGSPDARESAGESPVALPAVLTVDTCEAEATRFVQRRAAIMQRGRAWELVGEPTRAEVGFPYWLLYFRRRRRWDLRAVDAISGQSSGAIGKRSLIAALVQADRACEDRAAAQAMAAPRSTAEDEA